MKASTFADLVMSRGQKLIDGYKTSANNEVYAQVIIDKAIKQRWGVSTEHVNFGGTKIREIPYVNSESIGQVADFAVLHIRPPKPDPKKSFNVKNFIDKQTHYIIEVKTESGGAKGCFSGMGWKEAFKSDIEKLRPASTWIQYTSFIKELDNYTLTRARCFAVLISFDPETSAVIIANAPSRFPNSLVKTAVYGNYSFCVLIQEV